MTEILTNQTRTADDATGRAFTPREQDPGSRSPAHETSREPASAPTHEPLPPKRLASLKSFWLAAIGLAIVMASLVPIINNGQVAIPDEGVYSAQTRALANGGWAEPRPVPDVLASWDKGSENRFDPVHPSQSQGAERIPYGRHPLYSVILSTSYRTFDKFGLLVVSMLGGYTAAVLIGLISRRFDPRYGIPGMLLAGLSSPLVFNSYIVVAHSWATVLTAVLILAILSILNRPTPHATAPPAPPTAQQPRPVPLATAPPAPPTAQQPRPVPLATAPPTAQQPRPVPLATAPPAPATAQQHRPTPPRPPQRSSTAPRPPQRSSRSHDLNGSPIYHWHSPRLCCRCCVRKARS